MQKETLLRSRTTFVRDGWNDYFCPPQRQTLFPLLTMSFSNKHLTEVVCAFSFPEETAQWDSTYFGQFYDRIKSAGFTEKQERRGFAIRFEATVGATDSEPAIASSTEPVTDQVLFQDAQRGWVLLLGERMISFHVLKDYMGWSGFVSDFIVPFFEHYQALGLGNGPRDCRVVYINQFHVPLNQLSDAFTIVSPLLVEQGQETSCFVQRVVNSADANLLVARLNATARPEGTSDVILECGAVCTHQSCKTGDMQIQAHATHKPVYAFFEAITTPELRATL